MPFEKVKQTICLLYPWGEMLVLAASFDKINHWKKCGDQSIGGLFSSTVSTPLNLLDYTKQFI